MSNCQPLDPDRLLEQAAWVRRLAGRLLCDPAAADDVTQETLLTALGTGPRDAERPRPWLASIARNLVRRMRWSGERREARERATARTEALPATDEIVARASLLRAVVDAVIALPEPYRTTILLRHFEEVSAAEIAERRGEPVETVRTRLKRGLALLRERLSGELAALALLIAPDPGGAAVTATTASSGTSAAITGGSTMAIAGKATILIAAIVVTAVVTKSWTTRHDSGTTDAASKKIDVPDVTDAAARSRSAPAVVVASAAPGEATRVEDASGAALRDPNRWSDVTFESYGRLTHEDDGAEIRAAITGLESESLDFVALLKYLERSREESFVVPDAADTKQGIETTSVIGVQVYVNSKNERSVWRPQWTHGGKYERAGIMISADFWGSENVERLGLSPSWLRSSLLIDMSRDAAGRISGGVRLFPFPFGGPPGNDGEAASAKLKKLREEKQLPSDLRIDFTNGIGRRTWSRSGAGQALSAAECEQLTALFDALVETGKKVSGTDSK